MENTSKIRATTNWGYYYGDLNDSVTTEVSKEDIFIRPLLGDLLNEERAVMLKSPVVADACELQLDVMNNCHYKIEAITLVVSSAPKIELFVGVEKEYLETIYGTIIREEDDDEIEHRTEDQAADLVSYRYDVELQKSGVTKLIIKLLTLSDEICIYGIHVQIAPNPNGITTLQGGTINLENVDEMLKGSGHKLSSNAESCKLFLENYQKKAAESKNDPTNANKTAAIKEALLRQMQQGIASGLVARSQENKPLSCDLKTVEETLKTHIDKKVQDLEVRLNSQLCEIQRINNEKLDQILKLLQK